MNLRPQEEENVEENSLLCADNYTPYEEVDELKIIKSEIKPIDKKKKKQFYHWTAKCQHCHKNKAWIIKIFK